MLSVYVVFLFINTQEFLEPRKDEVEKFLVREKGAYSKFTILMDMKDEVARSYRLRGIPSKFVIDKDGNVRFSVTGFDGKPEAMIEELSLMIEMARGNWHLILYKWKMPPLFETGRHFYVRTIGPEFYSPIRLRA